MTTIYHALIEKYYGGETVIDELIDIEWGRIPHFYSSFYVYQYATGISAASALVQQILHEGQPAVDRYLKFLSSGSSDYSIELLKKAEKVVRIVARGPHILSAKLVRLGLYVAAEF